jgi:ABC-type multidrug transport system fused ATPase/permease subunit
VATGVYLVNKNLILGFLVLLIFSIQGLVQSITERYRGNLFKKLLAFEQDCNAFREESWSSVKTIKSFRAEDRQSRSFDEQLNRDRVIDYVKTQYGRDAVSQIVTFGTMAARAVIRDVGRTLDMSYTFCEGLSKLIPNKPGQPMTIALAILVVRDHVKIPWRQVELGMAFHEGFKSKQGGDLVLAG